MEDEISIYSPNKLPLNMGKATGHKCWPQCRTLWISSIQSLYIVGRWSGWWCFWFGHLIFVVLLSTNLSICDFPATRRERPTMALSPISTAFIWHSIWPSKPHEARKEKSTQIAEFSKKIMGLNFIYSLYPNSCNPIAPFLTFRA